MTREALAEALHKTSLINGSFTGRSGVTLASYFDKYQFESHPRLLKEVARQMEPLIPASTQVLAGLEMGGISIATALSLRTGLRMAQVRKTAKTYGTLRLVEGVTDLDGVRCIVIEDVVTSGGQIIQSTADLRALGALVEDVACVVLRRQEAIDLLQTEGLRLHPLFRLEELH